MTKHVTIGVAGHVDHGKTSFVRQITGIDTDRHAEEKQRGLSIEAGVACWPRPDGTVAAFVDVPGHSDFLKNTVRGLQGVDIAVLIVAADDGVMPQTREHLDLLSFFNVQDGIVVLSKTDCVDEETLEFAELEVLELVHGTFLEGASIVHFSALSGAGCEEVTAALDTAIAQLQPKSQGLPFRLWIDQLTMLPGVGTVVSGTVLSGMVAVNDELQILPDELITRVRSLEAHGVKTTRAVAGQRIGINLHRVALADIRRGMCLVQPGAYLSARRFNVELNVIRQLDSILHDRQKIKLYLGTSLHNAIVKFIDFSHVETDGKCFCQLQLQKPAAVSPGDVFVISLLNRNTIIAGGRVLEFAESKIRAGNKESTASRLSAMVANDLAGYLGHLCQSCPGRPIDPHSLAVRTVWAKEILQNYISSGCSRGHLVPLSDGRVIRKIELAQFEARIEIIANELFELVPSRGPLNIGEILNQCKPTCDKELVGLVVENICKRGAWVKDKGGFRPVTFEQRLPNELQQVAEVLRSYADSQGIRPFSAEFLVKTSTVAITIRQLQRVLDFFCNTGEIIRLKNDRYLTSSAMVEIQDRVRRWVDENGALCLRDCHKALDFNRGIGLPVFEHLDQIGFTAKKGEGRIVRGDSL